MQQEREEQKRCRHRAPQYVNGGLNQGPKELMSRQNKRVVAAGVRTFLAPERQAFSHGDIRTSSKNSHEEETKYTTKGRGMGEQMVVNISSGGNEGNKREEAAMSKSGKSGGIDQLHRQDPTATRNKRRGWWRGRRD